jgi:hypothetical protein
MPLLFSHTLEKLSPAHNFNGITFKRDFRQLKIASKKMILNQPRNDIITFFKHNINELFHGGEKV